MKASDLQKLNHHAMVLDRIAKFKVGEIQSITIQANMLSKNPGNRGEDAIGLRIDESDPRFQAVLDMLMGEATAQEEASKQVLTDAGMTPTVDAQSVAAYAASAQEARKEYNVVKERNRQKRLLEKALADEEAGKAPSK